MIIINKWYEKSHAGQQNSTDVHPEIDITENKIQMIKLVI